MDLESLARQTAAAAVLAVLSTLGACAPAVATPPTSAGTAAGTDGAAERPIEPVWATPRMEDPDDPAIWIHPDDPAKSLILGTDKVAGRLEVFGLDGRRRAAIDDLKRPNNVDVEHGVVLDGVAIDIAVVTERGRDRLRVFRLPDVEAIDGQGIPVFDQPGDQRGPMGVALYRRPSDGATFAIVSRKSGPRQGYVAQLRLESDGRGGVRGREVRRFGAFSGHGEIEAVAVDDELGFVYYSDERAGVRKYHADPDAPGADRELALFATDGFRREREGISIYTLSGGRGLLLVSDQQADEFRVFPRHGAGGDPHRHPEIGVLSLSTRDSDGSEVTSTPLGAAYPAGLFVAMSNDKTFQLYSWQDLADALGEVAEPSAGAAAGGRQ